jgi:hypothetical protein
MENSNPATGDTITMCRDVSANPCFGLWFTRGGFNRWHHLTLEPTNVPADSLDDARAEKMWQPSPRGKRSNRLSPSM